MHIYNTVKTDLLFEPVRFIVTQAGLSQIFNIKSGTLDLGSVNNQ